MKKFILPSLLLFTITLLSSCELVEGIFKAGVWTGIIVVVLIIALVVWLLGKVFGGRR